MPLENAFALYLRHVPPDDIALATETQANHHFLAAVESYEIVADLSSGDPKERRAHPITVPGCRLPPL